MTPAILIAALSVIACAGWSWSRRRTVRAEAGAGAWAVDAEGTAQARGESAGVTATRGDSPTHTMESALVAAATALRSGASLQAAWERHAAIPADADHLPRIEALMEVAEAQGVPAATAQVYARNIRAACRLAATTGAPLADVLDDIRAALDDLELARTERMAAMAGPRMTARVLLVMPAIGVLFGMALGVDPIAVFSDGGIGTTCLVVAAGLCAAGWAWSNRLIRGAEAAGGDHA